MPDGALTSCQPPAWLQRFFWGEGAVFPACYPGNTLGNIQIIYTIWLKNINQKPKTKKSIVHLKKHGGGELVEDSKDSWSEKIRPPTTVIRSSRVRPWWLTDAQLTKDECPAMPEGKRKMEAQLAGFFLKSGPCICLGSISKGDYVNFLSTFEMLTKLISKKLLVSVAERVCCRSCRSCEA